MYKILQDKKQFDEINNFASTLPRTDKWAEIEQHPVTGEFAMYVSKQLLTFKLPFLDENWFNDCVETLPDDWKWPHPETSIRITIPNWLVLKEEHLTALINYCKQAEVINEVNELNSYVYVNYILPEHQGLFDYLNEKYKGELILIESK